MKRKTQLAGRAGAAIAGNPSQHTLGNMSAQQTESAGDGFAKTATTRDGRTLDTSSEAWRLYREAELVLTLPDKSDRRKPGVKGISKREYLAGVRDKRGQHGYDVLRAEMVRLWKLRFQKESQR